jgi:hypothetical protein
MNVTRSALTSLAGQAVHTLNNTATQFAAHPSAISASGLPMAPAFGFIPGLIIWVQEGIRAFDLKPLGYLRSL